MPFKKLEIKKPCSQNWDEMTAMSHGRHCNSCNHVVHDFSEMTNDELVQVLQSGKYSCGRFEKNQLGLMYQPKTNNVDRKKYWNSIAAGIVGGILQISVGFTQAPIVKKELIIGTQTNRCIDCDALSSSKHTNEEPRKLSIDFKILDSETKEPIPYTYIKLFGTTYRTDSIGKVSIKMEANTDVYTELTLNIESNGYRSKTKRIQLINCVGVTHIYLRKIPQNKNKEYIMGFYY